MSELRLVPEALLSPTCCLRCQSHTGPFVDLGMEVHIEGHVYLCVLCVDSVTRCRGGCDPQEKASYEVMLADAEDLAQELRGEVRDAKRAVISELLAFQRELNGTKEIVETVEA